jgi:hypothetical protein
MRRFGGSLISHHPRIERKLSPYLSYDSTMKIKIETLKKMMDPHKIIVQ